MSLLAILLESDSERELPQRIYTTGYTDRNIALLPALLTSLDAILIDIRFTPISKQLQWQKDYLRLLLKDNICTYHTWAIARRQNPANNRFRT